MPTTLQMTMNSALWTFFCTPVDRAIPSELSGLFAPGLEGRDLSKRARALGMRAGLTQSARAYVTLHGVSAAPEMNQAASTPGSQAVNAWQGAMLSASATDQSIYAASAVCVTGLAKLR